VASCLIVQHVEAEPATGITAALDRAGVECDVRRLFDGDAMPVYTRGLDGVVVMGGPMSASRSDGFPTRDAEIALLVDAVGHAVPVLGICLGAQLLAAAHGGTVRPGARGLEVGWGPIALLEHADDDRLFGGMPREITVLHWHGETFDLPGGSVHLAASGRYANQAFRLGDCAWGLQFHLEVDEERVAAFAAAFPGDVAAVGTTTEGLLAATPAAVDKLAPVARVVLDRFASLVVEHSGQALLGTT